MKCHYRFQVHQANRCRHQIKHYSTRLTNFTPYILLRSTQIVCCEDRVLVVKIRKVRIKSKDPCLIVNACYLGNY
uniref:Putative ovule protein n=1 Tax=Solanum chacoense TaxID=4108 RepID=A0A0V0GUA3_SOLCH